MDSEVSQASRIRLPQPAQVASLLQSLLPVISPLLCKFNLGHLHSLLPQKLLIFKRVILDLSFKVFLECSPDDFVICKSKLTPVLSHDANALYFSFKVLEYLLSANTEGTDKKTFPSLVPHFNLIFSLSVKFKCHSTIHVYVEESNIHLFDFFQNCFNFSEVKSLFNFWKLSTESINMT